MRLSGGRTNSILLGAITLAFQTGDETPRSRSAPAPDQPLIGPGPDRASPSARTAALRPGPLLVRSANRLGY